MVEQKLPLYSIFYTIFLIIGCFHRQYVDERFLHVVWYNWDSIEEGVCFFGSCHGVVLRLSGFSSVRYRGEIGLGVELIWLTDAIIISDRLVIIVHGRNVCSGVVFTISHSVGLSFIVVLICTRNRITLIVFILDP